MARSCRDCRSPFFRHGGPRVTAIREGAQAFEEGAFPRDEDPLHRIMVMAHQTGHRPDELLGMDAGLFQAWEAWQVGAQRGRRVMAERAQ